MPRTLVVSALVVLASVSVSPQVASAGECAPRPLFPQIVTAEGATLPADGGIVVAQLAETSSPGAASPVTGWRFYDGKRRTAPRVRALAPGLEVLDGPGTKLENAGRRTLRSFVRGKDAGAKLAAPRVQRVVDRRTSDGRRTTTQVLVQLATAPKAAHFLVVFDKAGKVARSFGRAAAGARDVVVYAAHECQLQPEGTVPTVGGDQIVVAWVDETGRMSPKSSVSTVVAEDEDRGP